VSGQPYFLEAEPALEATLDGFLARLAADLARQPFAAGVESLVLGGGYGRGEGGVFRRGDAGEPSFYNDLEFFVFAKNPSVHAALAAWCHRWEREGTAELGIDVEFKRLAADTLVTAHPTMFYFDLLQGHRLVWGSDRLLREAPAILRDPASLPLSEPARLLFNRGSGLLFARWRLEEQGDDADGFVERNHAKLRLALADAVLSAAGRHDGSCRERARRIAGGNFACPSNFGKLQRWHGQGVQFKLRPRHAHPDVSALAAENDELTAVWLDVFLWLESRRLGATLRTGSDYLAHRGDMFPGTSWGRNLLLHARDRVRRGSALPGWTEYPRAALQRALVAAHEPVLGEGHAAVAIGAHRESWRAAYRRWWGYYN